MTLADLIQKATAIQRQFSSSNIKIYHGKWEVSFDLDVIPPKRITDSWKIEIVNYREE